MIDFDQLLRTLSRHRPLFHSEADFQHEIANTLRWMLPSGKVRLEVPLERPLNTAVDVLVWNNHLRLALELKFITKKLESVVDEEFFSLKTQGATDTRRYDVLKDVVRMEKFAAHLAHQCAAVIVVTNDPAYWNGPKSMVTNDACFSLRQGRKISGKLEWAETTGVGTKKGRELPINLRNEYLMQWQPYSTVDAKNGCFKSLVLKVP